MYIMCIIILPQPVCYPPEKPGVHIHLEAFFPHICKHRISIWSKIRKGIVFHPAIHSHTDERIIWKRTLSRFIEKHPALQRWGCPEMLRNCLYEPCETIQLQAVIRILPASDICPVCFGEKSCIYPYPVLFRCPESAVEQAEIISSPAVIHI